MFGKIIINVGKLVIISEGVKCVVYVGVGWLLVIVVCWFGFNVYGGVVCVVVGVVGVIIVWKYDMSGGNLLVN